MRAVVLSPSEPQTCRWPQVPALRRTRYERCRLIAVAPQRRGAIVGCRLTGKDHPSARDSIFPALIWKIHLLHGAQTRLVQNAAITRDAPGTLSPQGPEGVQGQPAGLRKTTQENPVRLQASHVGQ